MRSLSIFVPVFILVLAMFGVLPRLVRYQAPAVEQPMPEGFLPPTSITVAAPTAVPTAALPVAALELVVDPTLEGFAAPLLNGRPEEVVGVYAPGLFALPVTQQPEGKAAFVSEDPNLVTQFSLPNQYGATGLLAHNFLAGRSFYLLGKGQEIVVVYGDGRLARYQVNDIRRFQALTPNSPYSNFVETESAEDSVLTSANLFSRIYTHEGELIFQTCIEAEGDPSWGRLFVIADPVDAMGEPLPPVTQFVSSK